MTTTARRRSNSTSPTGSAAVVPRVVQMTPAWAKKLMEANSDNRHVRRSLVVLYRNAMKRGEWVLSNDAITVREDGVLSNGQHRLQAVIDSDITIPAILIENMPIGTQDAMDTGAKRKFGDVLTRRGEANANDLAAAVRQLWFYRNHGWIGGQTPLVPTHQEMLALLQREPGIRDGIPLGKRLRRAGLPIQTSIAGVLYYLFRERDPGEVEGFFERLNDGSNLTEQDPIWALRRQLIRARAGHASSNRINAQWVAALTIIAFNYWREGRKVTQLRWTVGGSTPQPFPEIAEPVGE